MGEKERDSKDLVNEFYAILADTIDFDSAHNEEQLKDEWQTEQQALRDLQITELLKCYVDGYSHKVKVNKKYRFWIMISCAVLVVAVAFCCVFATVKITPMENKSIGDIMTLITAYGGIIGSVLGVVKIITKYIFPENDEQYITEIVKAIQQNDLENKKVNINARIEAHKDSRS